MCIINLIENKYEVIFSNGASVQRKSCIIHILIKISINIKNCKKLPKVEGVKFWIPMFGVRVNV